MARGDVPDLVGRRFGDWEVLALVGRVRNQRRWRCRCACGAEYDVRESEMLRNRSRRCRPCSFIVTPAKKTHGMSSTAEYNAWLHILAQCYRKSFRTYATHGARGITVCDQWQGRNGFSQFFADMGTRPSPQHCLARINTEGNYEPENCRWQPRYNSRT